MMILNYNFNEKYYNIVFTWIYIRDDYCVSVVSVLNLFLDFITIYLYKKKKIKILSLKCMHLYIVHLTLKKKTCLQQ